VGKPLLVDEGGGLATLARKRQALADGVEVLAGDAECELGVQGSGGDDRFEGRCWRRLAGHRRCRIGHSENNWSCRLERARLLEVERTLLHNQPEQRSEGGEEAPPTHV
jgi:hypothetical protein